MLSEGPLAGSEAAPGTNRFQIDTTYGQQASDPVRRFHSFGLRFIY